jgi:1,4-dihydroxy-2-naphthoate octaprenyltransferase
LGEVFVVAFFGWVAVAGTVFVQTGHWPPEALLLGSQVGLLSAALISINNLRDREEDAGTGKRTLAVRLSDRGARRLVVGEIAGTVLLAPAWISFGFPWLAAAILPAVLLGTRIAATVGTRAEGRELNRFLALAGLQLVLFATAFHLAALG